jgi:hypothetical protein
MRVLRMAMDVRMERVVALLSVVREVRVVRAAGVLSVMEVVRVVRVTRETRRSRYSLVCLHGVVHVCSTSFSFQDSSQPRRERQLHTRSVGWLLSRILAGYETRGQD